MPAETRTLARARLIARAPRIALLTVTGVLALAGLRAAIAPARPASTAAVSVVAPPGSVEPFAEAFVRDYLTWTARRPGRLSEQRSAPR